MTELMSTDTNLAMIRQSEMRTKQAANLAEMSKDMDMEAIDDAAQEFEAMFLTEMLRPMFEGIKPDPMFGGGKGEEMFQSMMIEQYGKTMAERGGVGIADYVKAEMIRIQEQAQNQRPTSVLSSE